MRTGDLRRAAATLDRARARLDALIVERRAEGASLRVIAAEAGISHETVAGVLRRHDRNLELELEAEGVSDG